MATLIVETGSIVADANSYVTMEFADAYATNVGNATWLTQSPIDDKITALIRAASWLDGRYSSYWPGTRTEGRDQFMAWPRKDATDVEGNEIAEDEIPLEIKRAQVEAAFRELAIPGSLNPDVTETERVLREKVGEIEVQYADVTRVGGSIPSITVVDELLAPLIGRKTGTRTSFVVRA